MYNFKKKRILQKLKEKYDRHFSFVEHVILSCNTLAQLENAWHWAWEYCNQNSTFEQIDTDFDKFFVIDGYFDGKRDIIIEHYYRKREELLDF